MLTRHGKGRSVLVSVADVELLERLEYEADVAMPREQLGNGDVSDCAPHKEIFADLSE